MFKQVDIKFYTISVRWVFVRNKIVKRFPSISVKLNTDVRKFFRVFCLYLAYSRSVTTLFNKTFFDLLGIAQSRVLVCRWVLKQKPRGRPGLGGITTVSVLARTIHGTVVFRAHWTPLRREFHGSLDSLPTTPLPTANHHIKHTKYYDEPTGRTIRRRWGLTTDIGVHGKWVVPTKYCINRWRPSADVLMKLFKTTRRIIIGRCCYYQTPQRQRTA